MGSRPRSPSASPADRREPQPGGPGPAKRRRTEEPAGHQFEEAPGLDNVTGTPGTDELTSLVVLAEGCALHVTLDDVDLVLEPEPTSVMQVSLGDHTLILVPGALLGSGIVFLGGQGHSALVLEQGASPSGPGECIALEQGFFYGSVPEISGQEEVYEEDADAELLQAEMDAAAGSVIGLLLPTGSAWDAHLLGLVSEPSPWSPSTSPERGSPHHDDNLDLYLPEPFPDSPLQPLPPSPCLGPQERPQRPLGTKCKARRCLFQE
ncbi:proline-rich protein 23A-like [Hippopotamus amphibius kiboko]|uniref:proline-rich protein 23A-like n=1 Tax=Hippopotamus amphibius kiboko TaxID=575201 RepID=UPI0025963E0F|nr:proline-rich protein 23A-like [Hippopotamus amphibius kiboko]